ncbi:MAG: metallophosphoesterase [Muribaculaceae bacterium]
MRVSTIILLILLAISVILDIRIQYKLYTHSQNRKSRMNLYMWISSIFNGFIIAAILIQHRTSSNLLLVMKMWELFAFFSLLIPKIFFVILDIITGFFRDKKKIGWGTADKINFGIAIFVFIVLWWSALVTRVSINVVDKQIPIKELPANFEGYKIAQISDLHLGSYGTDTAFVSKMVNEINKLEADLVVFTGDFVNRKAREIKAFIPTLGRIKAHDGVIAIMGNHDYGDYVDWDDETQKRENHGELIGYMDRIGWILLEDDTYFIHRDSESIAIIGVENIGDPPFPSYGSLSDAYPTISDSVTKILLSHNPAHWVDDICNNDTANIALTLSGHTHAMQIELFGKSPSAFKYKTWGGLYTDDLGRHLYVNIGTGTVFIPARIGATPEITLLTLTNSAR